MVAGRHWLYERTGRLRPLDRGFHSNKKVYNEGCYVQRVNVNKTSFGGRETAMLALLVPVCKQARE